MALPKVPFYVNDAFIPYLTNQSRHLYLYGGAGSGKSWFAIQKIIRRILTEKDAKHKFVMLRKQAVDLKDSVVDLIDTTLQNMGIYHEFYVNKSEKLYRHLGNGNRIICRGLDDHHRIKSLEGATGMFIEEATEFTKDDLDQLNIRIRGEKKYYVQFIYSFNPIDENHHLKDRINQDKEHSTYAHFTYKDNIFLDDDYTKLLESYKETNPVFYDVYCLGKWGVHDQSNKFLWAFHGSKHVGNCEISDDYVLRLSFDFNLDPFAVVVYQKTGDEKIRIINEIMESSDIEQVCDKILSMYGNQEFIVTGDASGKARTGVVRGKRSYWATIRHRLELRDYQMRLRSRNIDLLESRLICNSVLNNTDIMIDKSCENLINDCTYAKVDDHGILVKDRKDNKNDFLDAFRYLCDAEYPDIIMRPKKYLQHG